MGKISSMRLTAKVISIVGILVSIIVGAIFTFLAIRIDIQIQENILATAQTIYKNIVHLLCKSFILIYKTYNLFVDMPLSENLKTIIWRPSGGLGHCLHNLAWVIRLAQRNI